MVPWTKKTNQLRYASTTSIEHQFIPFFAESQVDKLYLSLFSLSDSQFFSLPFTTKKALTKGKSFHC
jgi:hypothetical protein